MRSGKLIATNDIFINQLIFDDRYVITSEGEVFTYRDGGGHTTETLREIIELKENGYYYVAYGPKYNRKKLLRSRISNSK